MKILGLRNIGDTCFLNSSLQILLICILDILPDNLTRNCYCSRSLKKLTLCAQNKVAPLEFKAVMDHLTKKKFESGQHDAQEFIQECLDLLHDELKQIYVPTMDQICLARSVENTPSRALERISWKAWQDFTNNDDSVIKNHFFGQWRSTLTCKICFSEKNKFEAFNFCSISPTHPDLKACILDHSKIEILENVYCEKCNEKTNHTKSLELWKWPKILLIHFKRWLCFDMPEKNNTLVNFPVDDFKLRDKFSKKNILYDLYGVINHFGQPGGGHYKSMLRGVNTWYDIDDDVIVRVDIRKVVNPNAYILAYFRKD